MVHKFTRSNNFSCFYNDHEDMFYEKLIKKKEEDKLV